MDYRHVNDPCLITWEAQPSKREPGLLLPPKVFNLKSFKEHFLKLRANLKLMSLHTPRAHTHAGAHAPTTTLCAHTHWSASDNTKSKAISFLLTPTPPNPLPPFQPSQQISQQRQLSCLLKKKKVALWRSTLELTGYPRDGGKPGRGTRKKPRESSADTSQFHSKLHLFSVSDSPHIGSSGTLTHAHTHTPTFC